MVFFSLKGFTSLDQIDLNALKPWVDFEFIELFNCDVLRKHKSQQSISQIYFYLRQLYVLILIAFGNQSI